MTHLEILAGRLDKDAKTAIWLSSRYDDLNNPALSSYYAGKSAALHLAADMLRDEALEREGIDKEVSE